MRVRIYVDVVRRNVSLSFTAHLPRFPFALACFFSAFLLCSCLPSTVLLSAVCALPAPCAAPDSLAPPIRTRWYPN